MAQPSQQAGPAKLEFSVGENGEDIGYEIETFKWMSFVNGGYIIRVVLSDPNYGILNKLTKGSVDGVGADSDKNYVKYLKEGRSTPVEVKFRLVVNDENKTNIRHAYLTNLHARGEQQSASLEFIAIDPSSYILNAGIASGKIYKGNIAEVIKQVVTDASSEFPKPIQLAITQTRDSKENYWPQMRLDPKTFIMYLLDISSSLTQKNSRWIVSSGTDDKGTPKLNIKEEAELQGEHIGVYTVASNDLAARDAVDWNFEANNFISAFQTKLVTGGISATTGTYLDRITAPHKTVIEDKNTSEKVNTKTDENRAFTTPKKQWATFIQSIPEHNAGDVGVPYSDYMNGIIRQKFVNMTAMTMRLAVKVTGDYRLDDSEKLGTSTCTLQWKTHEGEDYFLSGNWIIYGFEHSLDISEWHTVLYLYRIDHDSESKIIGPNAT